MIDVDHFKAYNDHYGHVQGDQCLRQVAQALSASVGREGEMVARYGGEEFVALLEGDSAEQASLVCERIRGQIGQLRMAALQDTALSASIGVAVYEPGDDAGSLLERADKALYQAKAEGRNCVRMLSLDGIGASLLASAATSGMASPERCCA